MMMRKVCLFVLFAGLVLPGFAVQDSLQHSFDLLVRALNEHDFKLLEPVLSPDYIVPGVPKPYAVRVLNQVVDQYPRKIIACSVSEVHWNEDHHQVRAKLASEDRIKEYDFLLDQQFRFVEINIFRTKTDQELDQPENQMDFPEQQNIDFTVDHGLIRTAGTLNGLTGWWLVDSGAPRTIINQLPSYTDSVAISGSSGIGGTVNHMDIQHFQSMAWGSFSNQDFDCITMDLSHLEKETKAPLLGLIGYDSLEPYIIRLDYDHRTLQMRILDENGTPPADFSPPASALEIPFTMSNHIPVFDVSIGNDTFRIGLDTGAQENAMDLTVLRQLVDHFTQTGTDSLIGADKAVREVPVGVIDQMTIGSLVLENQTTVFTDFSHFRESEDQVLHGLTGYQFLNIHPVWINFRKTGLWIEKN